MSATRGSTITLKIGAAVFQGLVSKNFSGTTATEDATTQDSGGATTHNPGDLSWSVGFKSLLDPSHTNGVQEILTAWLAKTEIATVIESVGVGEPIITGVGTITSVTLNGDHGSTASCDGTITGKGTVVLTEVAAA